MKRSSFFLLIPAIAASLFSAAAAGAMGAAGAVYTMTNAVSGNEVLAYARSAGGTLTPMGAFPTGGAGTGAGLGNQGGVILDDSERWLAVVNAGSHDISLFRVEGMALTLTARVPSPGMMPLSLTMHGNLLYVVYAGSGGGIGGFRMSPHGQLDPIPGSMQPLDGPGAAPAQISFSPSGRVLLVSIKNTDHLITYTVARDGSAGAPQIHASAGPTPFGFAFGKRGQVFVSEAAGGAPGISTTSSYEVEDSGTLRLISAAVSAGGTAACWVAVTPDGRFAYVANTGSNNLGAYSIRFDGQISLEGNPSTLPGAGPLDLAFSNNGRYLYVLNGASSSLGAFQVGAGGSLVPVDSGVSGLPPGTNGLAAR